MSLTAYAYALQVRFRVGVMGPMKEDLARSFRSLNQTFSK